MDTKDRSLLETARGKQAVLGLFIVSLLTANLFGDEDAVVKLKDWPKEVFAHCGDITVRFDAAKSWTLSRIEWKGNVLSVDAPGTSWGSVIKFSDHGFIGSGHKEEGKEEHVEGVDLLIDGSKVPESPKGEYRGESASLRKRSKIKGFELINSWTVKDGVIQEEVELKCTETAQLDLAYAFMYPWLKDNTHYLALLQDGKEVSGEFEGNDKFKVMKPAKWLAVYDAKRNTGAVTVYTQVPEKVRAFTRLWDKESPYKKHYLQYYRSTEVPAGEEIRLQARTGFFEVVEGDWREAAKRKADELEARRDS